MTYKDAYEIIYLAWTGRKDKKGYPDFDDIWDALGVLEEGVKLLEKGTK